MRRNFHMPEDLLIDLITRWPVDTLARFKCVSKQWNILISNTIRPTKPKLLILSSEGKVGNKSLSFRSMDINENRIQSVRSPLEKNLLHGRHVRIHSSLNGLLLIQIGYDLFLWNPLTNFFQKVHTYSDLLDPSDYHQKFVFDLCFDFADSTYKVVVVEKFKTYSGFCDNLYVASCCSSSRKKIHVRDGIENFTAGPFFKGHRHWICEGYPNNYVPRSHIVYFDPQKNEFVEVPIPQPKHGNIDHITGLGVLDEWLCMTRFDYPGNFEGNIEFLVMKEYGIGDSWNILFTIPNVREFRCFDDMKPLFKTKDGEILVGIFTYYQSIISIDMNGNFLRTISASSPNICDSITFYEESWSSPTCYEWEIPHNHTKRRNSYEREIPHHHSKRRNCYEREIPHNHSKRRNSYEREISHHHSKRRNSYEREIPHHHSKRRNCYEREIPHQHSKRRNELERSHHHSKRRNCYEWERPHHHSKRRKRDLSPKREGPNKKYYHRDVNKRKGKGRKYE